MQIITTLVLVFPGDRMVAILVAAPLHKSIRLRVYKLLALRKFVRRLKEAFGILNRKSSLAGLLFKPHKLLHTDDFNSTRLLSCLRYRDAALERNAHRHKKGGRKR